LTAASQPTAATKHTQEAAMPWTCPDCKSNNSDELEQCFCGYPNSEKNDTTEKSLKTCPSCHEQMPAEDKFCSFCGKTAVVLTEKEKKKIRKASKWILAISIMFIFFGTILGFVQKSTADKAIRNLAQYEESDIWETPINGKKYTVGELRTQIDREVILVFGTNYFLAAIMFGLYLYSRKAPFPAMVTALCVYLAVIVLNSIIDPATIIQGIIIKIIFISALIAGIKTSLVARGLTPTQLNA
jgi:predicted nucleic acid-binding Zn ribbon protein